MKPLIFDFDGTLVDSMPYFSAAMVEILDDCGTPYPDDILKTITPLGCHGTAEYYKNVLGVPMSLEEILSAMIRKMYDAYLHVIPAKETVLETLQTLRANGYSLHVLTASPHLTLDPCLCRNGLYDLFDNVWSCDDFSTTKSDVGIYHAVAAKLGTVASECVFFDDNINALATAKEAGMTVVGVYDATSDSEEQNIRSLSSRYLRTFAELLTESL